MTRVISNIRDLTCNEFSKYLTREGVHEEVIELFSLNRICGETFCDLNEEDLKELLPVVGDRVRIRRLLKEATVNQSEQSSPLPQSKVANSRNDVSLTRGSVSPGADKSPARLINSEWHVDFEIPDFHTFSSNVKEAVDSGVTTGIARREIIQVLRTYMLAHTTMPNSEQYNTVCRKLVTKYPKLRDTEGDSYYGSWKLHLRTAFKNYRKKSKKQEKSLPISVQLPGAASSPVVADQEASFTEQPAPKRVRLYSEDENIIDEEEYEEAVQKLQEECKSKKGKKAANHSIIKNLMEKTKLRRHQWIRQDRPLILEILDKFPYLSTSRWIRREFKAVVSFEQDPKQLMDDWPFWRERIIQLAKKESATRPYLKKILASLESSVANEEEHQDVITLELLSRLLYPRGFGKNGLFIKRFEDCDVDIDAEVSTTEQSEPFLVMTGITGETNFQVFVCAEQAVLVESKTVQDSLIDLLAAYFVFDISYPKCLSAILLFIQHHVFKLKDEQTAPTATNLLVRNLQKLN